MAENLHKDLDPKTRAKLRNLFHASPLLWAIVRGCGDAETIARRLQKPVDSVEKGIRSALAADLIRYSDAGLIPVNRHHLGLYKVLNPDTPVPSLHPIMDVLGDRTMTTADIAAAVQRPYHSVYKTLQRLEVRGSLTRVNKSWRRA